MSLLIPSNAKGLKVIQDIRKFLQPQVPLNGLVPGQAPNTVVHPEQYGAANSLFYGCSLANSYSIDRFLYDIDEVKQLLAEEKIQAYYCTRCKAIQPRFRKKCRTCKKYTIEERTRITCSITTEQSMRLFTKLLPYGQYDFSGKQLLDIGSRLGNQLFTAAVATNLPSIVGIEYEPFFANLSARVVERFGTELCQNNSSSRRFHEQRSYDLPAGAPSVSGRIRIKHADIMTQQAELERSDIVIFFNPFEQIWSRDASRRYLKFFRNAMTRKGVRIVSCPALSTILAAADSDVQVEGWVKKIHHVEDLFMYEVV